MTNKNRIDELTLPTEAVAETPLPEAETGPLPARFERRGMLGPGGMGEVFLVYDTHLERDVALKIVPQPFERVLKEARMGARLEHPGIVSVYDAGPLPKGGWLSMRLVQGQDLGDLFASIRDGRQVWPRRRLVATLHQVAQAMAYAHQEKVVHLDLKPANIRLGKFGEVVILDWGIASLTADTPPVAGTVGFAAPERLRGAPPTPQADVYAMGQILQIMMNLSESDDDGDEALRLLRDRATAYAPRDRPADGRAFADALQAWLDGSDRRAQALALVRESEPLVAKVEALRNEAGALREAASRILAPLRPWTPVNIKAKGWDLEAKADRMGAEAAQLTLEVEQRLRAALQSAPLDEARRRLGHLIRRRLLAAEARDDPASVAEQAARLRTLDPEVHGAFLAGDGHLSLQTTPERAAVYLASYTVRNRRLVLGPERLLGHTPLDREPVPRGSHRLRLEAPGCASVVLPIFVEREAHVEWRPPAASHSEAIWLPPEGALGPRACYVPAGWFRCGGDPLAVDGLSHREVWVDGFVIEREPLTYARLLPVLNELVKTGQAERASKIAPTLLDPTGKGSDGQVGLAQAADGTYHLVASGPFVEPEQWPVNMMSWVGAVHWAAYEAERTGLPWRLPHELEREKAARGVDGRRLPWGNHAEPTWACTSESWPGPPSRVSVASYPEDESPYGARGMAGNIRDWCLNPFQLDFVLNTRLAIEPVEAESPGEIRVARGGAWGARAAATCHAASRYAATPTSSYFFVGVRLARSVAR